MASFLSRTTTQSHIHRIKDELWLVFLFIAAIWGVFLLDRFLPLEQWGLIPRDSGGLVGIMTMPFLHGSYTHLLNNTVPLVILLVLLAGSRADTRWVVLGIMLLSGLLLWLFGRSALHIGASALVFGLAVFVIMSGLLERRAIPLILSAVVIFMYGGTLLLGVLPGQRGVSWDGHLFGAIAGALVAWLFLKRSEYGR
ncbi:MAG: rhomboid family intramembrane serine protease [Thiofilum sp.]|uniref:rhomboid family intramembrane serine protease n=1 Tax=Thiofilum sp. TaxID=2212733 RepID=UPI0025E50045|nr:rhomboid family intramembrane serine protease [Thiofilum sp.]MBK8453243.1 rhomboid family intramembrane serine protease [Thiofilum sp.]